MEVDVDILHLLYFDRTQLPLYGVSRRVVKQSGVPPVVATLHRDAFTDAKSPGVGKRATQWVTRRALNGTLSDGSLAYLTVHAESIRDRIIDAVAEATRENTRVIPAPTPEIEIDVSQAAAQEFLSLPGDDPVVLFFGGYAQRKARIS